MATTALANLAMTPILTHLIGSADYGRYLLAVAIVFAMSTLAVGWVTPAVVRLLPAYQARHGMRSFTRTALLAAAAGIAGVGLGGGVVLWVTSPWLPVGLSALLWLALGAFAVDSAMFVLLSFLRARRALGWYVPVVVWSELSKMGFGIALVVGLGPDPRGLLWGAILGSALALPVLLVRCLRDQGQDAGTLFGGSVCGEMARFGVPVMVMTFLMWVLGLSDRYLLAYFWGDRDVGVYAASYHLSEKTVLLVVTLFNTAAGPLVFQAFEQEGADAAARFVARLARYYLLIAMPLTAGIWAVGRSIVEVLVAPEYHAGYRVMPLVAISVFLYGLMHFFAFSLTLLRKTGQLLGCLVVAASVNVGLNLVLIPGQGFMGAAVATLVAYVVLFGAVVVVARRSFTWRFPFGALGSALAASLVMGVVASVVARSGMMSATAGLIGAVAVGAAVYCAVLVALGALEDPEKRLVSDALRWVRARVAVG